MAHRPLYAKSKPTKNPGYPSTWSGKLVVAGISGIAGLIGFSNHVGTSLYESNKSRGITNAKYESTPFCAPNGNCGEEPDLPSPRTVFSANSKQQYDEWWDFHKKLNSSAAAFAKRLQTSRNDADKSSGPPLILLGDSITESYLGSNLGIKVDRRKDVPHVFESAYKNFTPLVLAASGDQTQHLLWRLKNGQLLPEYANDADAIFVVLIGTNNLGSGHLPGPTAKGVLAVTEHVLKHTSGRLILLEVLPRGDNQRVQALCPPRCNNEGKPFSSFMPAVNKVNAELRTVAPNLSERFPKRFHLLDCSQPFLPPPQGQIYDEVNIDLMPDRLHPNGKGHELITTCVLDCINNDKC